MNVKTTNKIKKLSIIMAITLLLVSLSSISVFADDLKVVGNNLGLLVSPGNTNLFDESNLNPGDCKEATVTIENSYTSPFELYLKINRDQKPLIGEPDLLKQIIATISYKGKNLYKGPMSEFNIMPDGKSLGIFNPGDVQEIKIEVCLPGPETGNEFMGLSASNQWIFTAQGEETIEIDDEDPPLGPIKEDTIIIEDEEIPIGPAKLPKTGASSNALFYILGTGMILAGGVIIKKD